MIVAASAAGSEGRFAEAVTLFHATFDEAWDVNYDGWPDRWIRKTGPQYPHYVDIAIHEDPTAPHQRCLRIDLDGAAAAVSSPPIRVMPLFSYEFEAQLKTEAVEHSKVVISLDFCDSSGRVLQTRRSKSYSRTGKWTTVRIERVEPADPAIDRVVVTLQVQRSIKGDLEGRISLADLRLARLPRIAISTNNPANVYTDPTNVVVRCELSGIPERDPEIRFQLLDSSKNNLQSERFQLNGRLIVDDSKSGEVRDGEMPDCYEGSLEWRPKLSDYGYYRVVVKMLSTRAGDDSEEAKRELASRTICLAVVPPLPMPRHGEFGWTLPQGDIPLSFQDLSRLLPQVGVNWVKVPVWFDANEPHRGDELIRFVEMLGASNIEVVGIIDRPPASTELGAALSPSPPIAELLSLDSSRWAPSLEPVMTRLSLRVRWWQLGRDFDTSFSALPALNERIAELRKALFRFGQDVRLGLNWDAANSDSPVGQPVTWDFQQQCAEGSAAEGAFDQLLAKNSGNQAMRWVFVEPPPQSDDAGEASKAELDARAGEFVRQLVAAKVHAADAIIVANPFDDRTGLMRTSGMPAELLLPWRTTAAMLGGAKYQGTMQLPAGSENRIFRRPDGTVVMVVWNKHPVEEVLYLGKEVSQYDVYGRSMTPRRQEREHVLQVDSTPTFVLGLHEAITRWRMSVEFEHHQVPSIFQAPHANSLRFQNFFNQGVGGSLKIVVVQQRGVNDHVGDPNHVSSATFTPDRWTIDPPHSSFQLSAGQSTRFPFEIRLKNAIFGKQPIRVDFKVEAEEQFEFSVYREMEVGTEDLTLEVNSRLENDGTLIVEQLMTNTAERLADLKCYLYARGRRPERMQVYRLGTTVDRKVYRFPQGEDLVGNEMLLEIEELNGPRILRYRFLATAESSEPDSSSESAESAEQDSGSDEQAEEADATSPISTDDRANGSGSLAKGLRFRPGSSVD